MRFLCLWPLLCVVAFVAVSSIGCASADVRTFSLEVKNASSKPITIGLTKNGPPMEPRWESPADRAMMDIRNTGIGWGAVIPPGKTAYVDNVTGEFVPGTSPFLRVYLGDLPLNDLLAFGPDSRMRTDIRLREGKTYFLVSDKGPLLDIIITGYEPGGEEAKRSPTVRTSP